MCIADVAARMQPGLDRAHLLDGLGQAVVATDADGRITYWNAAAESLYGWGADEALGKTILALTMPEFSRDLGDEIIALIQGGESWSGGLTVRRKDSTTFTALVTAVGLRDRTGVLSGMVTVSTNIGNMLRPLVCRSQDAALVTGVFGVVRFASPAVERVLGWSDAELAGHSLLDLVHPEDQVTVEQCVEVSRKDPTAGPTVEFRALTVRGSWTWVEGVVANLRDDPSVLGLVWTLRDISDRRAALERMTDFALHDPLTGLANRVLLSDRLARATARREPQGALLFIDLDDFKLVNDEMGHAAGDELLRTVAMRLTKVVRPEDSCARWAGDEFVVLSESLRHHADAVELAGRVAVAIAEPVEIAGRTIRAQVSIGIAMLQGVRDPNQVIHLADEHMYRVKQEHHATRDG